MPATVWALMVSQEWTTQSEWCRERHTGVEQLVPSALVRTFLRKILNLRAWAAMSGMPRPSGLHKSQSKKRLRQVTAASALVEASILGALALEECGHGDVLVGRARKVVRKATSREGSRNLGVVVCSAADGSEIGTCGTT